MLESQIELMHLRIKELKNKIQALQIANDTQNSWIKIWSSNQAGNDSYDYSGQIRVAEQEIAENKQQIERYKKDINENYTYLIKEYLHEIYIEMYDDNYDSSLFYDRKCADYLRSALTIIAGPQTDIGLERICNVLSGKKDKNVNFSKENSCITLHGKNKAGKIYYIVISLTNNEIKISNRCTVVTNNQYGKQEIVCDIPETISGEEISKNETSHFILPKAAKGKSDFEKLFYSSAQSSIQRVLGRPLTEAEIKILQQNNGRTIPQKKENEIEPSVQIGCHQGQLVISDRRDPNHILAKFYSLGVDEGTGQPCVVYKKKELIKVNAPKVGAGIK